MTNTRRFSSLAAGMTLMIRLSTALAAPPLPPSPTPDLQTVAESSGFSATSTHAHVLDLLGRLAALSPNGRMASIGQTKEQRPIPVLWIADPPVSSSDEAAEATIRDGRMVVVIEANIHAGEVDGKEAVLILAREILTAPAHPFLRGLILAVVPNYNPDGNDRISTDHRTSQNGPARGVGIRENADGLDLNRDFMKLDAAETRGLVDLVRRSNASVILEMHTTNGCFHRYAITYDGPRTPAADSALVRFTQDVFLPRVSRSMDSATGLKSFSYGDFDAAHTRWDAYPALPRYGTQYFALRGLLSVLVESYSYDSYQQRIKASYHYARHVLADLAEHANRTELSAVLSAARTAPEDKARSSYTLRHVARAMDAPRSLLGFVERVESGAAVSTGEPRDYSVSVWTDTQPLLAASIPAAYALPEACREVVENLERHGVRVERLAEPARAPCEFHRVDRIDRAEHAYQQRRAIRLETTVQRAVRDLPIGTVIVRTSGPLHRLIVHLLEPLAEDGLTTWAFFDPWLLPGGEFPVIRVMDASSLSTRP
ncbi:MAG: M14 family metallopeptidase [Phycisphaerae bacterium]|nr:M14 family metallopeptidase [Phycisphaerae bacterium]